MIRQDDKEIYIEHFGLTEKGTSNRFSSQELEKYKKAVHDKIEMHEKHGTKLIWTLSSYNNGRSHIEHLKTELERNRIVLQPRDTKKVMQKIINTEGNKYIRKMIALLQRFNLAKALSEYTKAKIMAVGDDWQSIYAFSGSDITLFTEFAKSVGYASQMTQKFAIL